MTTKGHFIALGFIMLSILLATLPAEAQTEGAKPNKIGIVIAASNSHEPNLKTALMRGIEIAKSDLLARKIVLDAETAVVDAAQLKPKLAEFRSKNVAEVLLLGFSAAEQSKAQALTKAAKFKTRVYASDQELTADYVIDFLHGRLRLGKIGHLYDRDPLAKGFSKTLKKACKPLDILGFQKPANIKIKQLIKAIEKNAVDVLYIDVDAGMTAALASAIQDATTIPIVFSARAAGPKLKLKRNVLFLKHRAASTHKNGQEFTKLFREKHESYPRAAAESYDAVMSFFEPRKDGPSKTSTFAGIRGQTQLRVKDTLTTLYPELALWSLFKGEAQPLLPGLQDTGVLHAKAQKRRIARRKYGSDFGDDRSNRFAYEKETRCVVVGYGSKEESTIDEDLKLIGLSSQGAAPLVDHLIKEEILARVMAISSQKYLRNPDGTSIPGESLRISFVSKRPKSIKANYWRAVIAGDDPEAGGRAFPGQGLAKTFSTFLRRTIYQKHAFDPPVNADDLSTLLGCKSEDEFFDDIRAKELHALIDGFAGGLALTNAHEVGHLAGLGHNTVSDKAIMNVIDGGGLDYRLGVFIPANLATMAKTLGVVPKPRR